ncbi:hypothetical protein D9756_010233 [Leucocoprinus leucothites]|uniref:Complex 1 LYR protein domain-containing protein n=1 Tax=Leucocoprinus leucothites TaxID=201217 RepID=A0A8H5CTI4_9AGAR|nr:hypothetical protein D9756_010233 [Leucoagaricus leucothites]
MTSTRESIRQLLKPLQRARPRTPFWNIPAHRAPTLTLYRNLLKEAPTDAICFRIRMLWKRNRNLTSVEQTQNALRQGYKYLDIFHRANAGDAHLQDVLRRYSRLIDVRCEKEYWKYLLTKELVWRAKLRYRPILTGASFSPSPYHKPLPRMINQPVKLSQMIRWRIQAHLRRNERHQAYLETIADIRNECRTEAEVSRLLPPPVRDKTVFAGYYGEWTDVYKGQLSLISKAYDRANERAKTPFPQALLKQLKEARRERIRNKTKERVREIRGETTRSLGRRLRQRPPAHVLNQMTPEQRRLDEFARHPSEVGYTAIAKQRLGRGFKNPDAWMVEESREKKAELDAIAEAIRQQNKLKREADDRSISQDKSTMPP